MKSISKRLILIIVILFAHSFAFSQVNTNKDVAIKYIDSFDMYMSKSEYKKASFYLHEIYLIATKKKDNYLLSRYMYKKAILNFANIKLDQTNNAIDSSIVLCIKTKNYKTLAANYNLKGELLSSKSDYKHALKYYFKSLKIADKHSYYDNKTSILLNIGLLYLNQKDTINAMNFYKRASKIASEKNFADISIDINNEIGTIIRKKQPKKAESYFLESYRISKTTNNNIAKLTVIINLTCLIIDYPKLFEPSRIPLYLKEAEEVLHNDTNNYRYYYIYFNYGGYYAIVKDFKRANFYYKKAESYINKGIKQEDQSNIYYALALNYYDLADYKNAYEYQKRAYDIDNKLITIERIKNINELQTQYDVEKKNLKINLLTKDKLLEAKKKQLYSIISIVVALFTLGLYLFYKKRLATQQIIQQQKEQLYKQEKETLEKETQLQSIKADLEGQEKERNRIAKEIHDGVGGKLALIKHNLQNINNTLQNQGIEDNVSKLSETFSEIRTLSHNLSSNFTKHKSFYYLFSTLIEDFTKHYSIAFDVVVFPENLLDTIDTELKHHLYRILQELLTNIVKHAQATEVHISFTQVHQTLSVIVEDNGVGFNKESKNGIGLSNIEERIALLKGTFQIDKGEAGRGSSILIDVPNKIHFES